METALPKIQGITHSDRSDPLMGLTCVEVNPTELCNRTCVFCPRVDPNVYPNQNLHMTSDTLTSLVNNLYINNYKGRIVFSGMGEPTLAKNILNLISLAKGKINDIQLYTNGDKILNDEWYTIDEFIDAGVTSMFVDVYDDADQMKKWQHKIKKYKLPIHLSAKYTFPIKIFTNRAGTVKTQGVPQNVYAKPCFLPHTKAFVDWDGSLLLCCNDWARAAGKFGNVNETPFHELWMSSSLNNIRKKLISGSRQNAGDPCNVCNAVGNQKLADDVRRVWRDVLH
jgi:sulfatase maturation enzyme AslB (radical SAM superfamily)